jgi:GAF domain-containing protein
VIHDADREDCIADPSRQVVEWRSYMGTGISVDARSYGVLAFVDRSPRDSIDVADRDFAQLLGALVGSALERAERARRLGRMAFTDGLTSAQRRGSRVIAPFIDLDGFKKVNDTHGHAAGDEALREVAARLIASIRGGISLRESGGTNSSSFKPIFATPTCPALWPCAWSRRCATRSNSRRARASRSVRASAWPFIRRMLRIATT